MMDFVYIFQKVGIVFPFVKTTVCILQSCLGNGSKKKTGKLSTFIDINNIFF